MFLNMNRVQDLQWCRIALVLVIKMCQQLSSNSTIETPVHHHIGCLTKSYEKLWAQTTVLESQNKDLKKVVSK